MTGKSFGQLQIFELCHLHCLASNKAGRADFSMGAATTFPYSVLP
jgi:hypothetical protein